MVNKDIINSWPVRLGGDARFKDHVLTTTFSSPSLSNLNAEDPFLIAEEQNGILTILGVGRVFRKKYSQEGTSFYFDSYLPASQSATLDELNISLKGSK
jgi:hypothetical protein